MSFSTEAQLRKLLTNLEPGNKGGDPFLETPVNLILYPIESD
jgi:hypothetical protein